MSLSLQLFPRRDALFGELLLEPIVAPWPRRFQKLGDFFAALETNWLKQANAPRGKSESVRNCYGSACCVKLERFTACVAALKLERFTAA